MRGQSHRCLGRYLADHYLMDASPIQIKAFQIGCIEPDRNPITYLKGSIRCQWLRGHNYRNARRFMRKISFRLEHKKRFHLFDFYTLGKLIHYTTDAFTFAHNATFPTDLSDHKQYEDELQIHFLKFMEEDPKVDIMVAKNIMSAICSYHREYEQLESNIHNDSRFALSACCCILALLFVKPIL